MSKYNIVYKITNELNGKIYIGCHQTEDLNDGYMGSGTYLHRAFKKYGIENFTKEILFKFDVYDEMFEKEAELVNEDFVKRQDTYNLMLGGKGWNTKGLVLVINKDKTHRTMMSKNDPRYNVEYFPIGTGKVRVKDKDGNISTIDKDDPKYLSGELIFIHKNKVVIKDKNGKTFQVDKDDPKYLSGEYISIVKNTINVKDKNDNIFRIDINDPRYLSGELVPIWKGRKLSEEHKNKLKETRKLKQPGKGEKNSQYGKCWITNGQESKKIYKGDNIPIGWKLGRVQKKK